MYEINETHDPNLKSWVESANDPATDFPIQNLPFCVFSDVGGCFPRVGVIIGDQVFDFENGKTKDLFSGVGADELQGPSWLYLHAFGPYRKRLSDILRDTASTETRKITEPLLLPFSQVQVLLPFEIHDYTDFY
ncbi:MAG: fumarylacetoacetase, partial [Acidobacteria bacterium]|nr:fumarylacetoacetase [Acidobacteriota bacterium]